MITKTSAELAKIYKADLDGLSISLASIHNSKRLGRVEQKQLVDFITESKISKKNAGILFKVSYASVMNWFSNTKDMASKETSKKESPNEEVKRLKHIINTFIELGGEDLYSQVKEQVNKDEYQRFMEEAEQQAKSLLNKDLI